jgi:Ser/Thr protein kinase RdoA (MazF antagonist)
VFVSNPYDRDVLPVGELVGVARTVDDDGSSPLALRVAEPWRSQEVRFLRSSANHVFVCDNGVLRFRPEEAGSALARGAEVASRLAGTVAPPVPSVDGELAVHVQGYVAAMFGSVPGRQVDEESLTPELARAWGQALARFHETASQLDPPPAIPLWLDAVAEAASSLSRPEILHELRRLPTSDALAGVVHGDPELDNVIWNANGEPIFVDVDDVSRSWFAADVCFALRDFEGSPLAADFVAGYREARPLTDEELTWLPQFRRAHALVTLAGLERVLAEPVADDWPDWAKSLHARLHEVAARLRTVVA